MLEDFRSGAGSGQRHLPGAPADRVDSGVTRQYWIQAEPYQADAAPSGHDDMMGMPLQRPVFWGLRYRAYSQGWEQPLPASAEVGPNEGIPGPVIRANVGDTILVHFRNADDKYRQPHSIRAHGLHFDESHDGTWTATTQSRANAVRFGESFTYRWLARRSSLGAWNYQDASRPFDIAHPEATEPGPQSNLGSELGLVGFIVISDGQRPPPDREFFVVYGAYLNDIPGMMTTMTVNGRTCLGNTPDFRARVGDRVRWYVMGARQTYEHDFHVHGHRWWNGREYDDVVSVYADDVAVVEWIEDNPGRWLYHCHVELHMDMTGWYIVESAPKRTLSRRDVLGGGDTRP